jgi:hypothetical protein
VKSGGIMDDDQLIVHYRQEPFGTKYWMAPHKKCKSLIDHVIKDLKDLHLTENQELVGILLYTDADTKIAESVRSLYLDIDRMSGRYLRIHVLEHQPSKWRDALNYWRIVFEKYKSKKIYMLWSFLHWLTTMPLDKAQAYDVAAELGVYPDDMPCMVLVSPKTAKRLVIPIDGDINNMRSIFSVLMRISDKPSEDLHGDQILEQVRESLQIINGIETLPENTKINVV